MRGHYCKHKIYPTNLTHLQLEASLIVSTSSHHKRLSIIDRESNKLAKVTWTKVIKDCMKKLQGSESIRNSVIES